MTPRRCSKCGEHKAPEVFGANPSWCRDCRNIQGKTRRSADHAYRDEIRAKVRERQLAVKTGNSVEAVRAFIARAGRSCEVCGTPEGVRKHHVDHDHTTGALRGLLCVGCNTALGNVRESVEVLSGLIDYLRRHKKNFGQHV